MSIEVLRDISEPLIPGMIKPEPIKYRYKMPDVIEANIRSIRYRFGYGGFSEAVYYRTYSQTDASGNKENYPDTIIRVVNGVLSIRKDWYMRHGIEWNDEYWNQKALEFGVNMMEFKLLPPGRGLWISGTEFAYERGSAAFNNCGFCSVREGLTKAATWTMDSLMCGCGIGFDVETNSEFDDLSLPGCPECYYNVNSTCSCNKLKYIVHDSREGWVKSMYLLLESYFGRTDGRTVHFDYSEVRKEGIPIKGFGGVASGPEPLRILHERVRVFMKCFVNAKLDSLSAIREMIREHIAIYREDDKTYESIVGSLKWALGELDSIDPSLKTYGKTRLITDIFNAIGICIVAGNVRRSSEIALGGANDSEFLYLKNHSMNPERSILGWMSNNTVVLKETRDFDRIPQISERILNNGEPGILNQINATRYGRVGKKNPIGREAEEDKCIGMNPCVTGDTQVMTSNGLKRVDELIGVKFTTVVGGVELPSTNAGFWSNGVKKVYKLTLSNGMELKLTEDHKVLCLVEDAESRYIEMMSENFEGNERLDSPSYKWVRSCNLTKDSVVALCSNSSYDSETVDYYDNISALIDLVVSSHNRNNSYYVKFNDIKQLQIELMSYLGINSQIVDDYLQINKKEFELKLAADLNNFETKYSFNPSLAKFRSLEEIGDEEVYDCSIPYGNWFAANGIVVANCGEIPLESFEFCNLAEIFPSRCKNFSEYKKAAELATLYASTISLLPTHWSYSNKVIGRNRRIGISISGITNEYETLSFTHMTSRFKELYRAVRAENKRLADEAGVCESIRVTTVKPSGTISQLVGVPSGIHFNTYKYCIRRMRISSNSDIVPILKEAGYNWEYDRMSGKGTTIFEFPLHQGDHRTAEEVTLWEQAALQASLQREWADNSVSCTLYFNREKEGGELGRVLAHHAPLIKSASALPHCNDVFPQMPYEKITKEEYEKKGAQIRPIDWSKFTTHEEAIGSSGCDGDLCDIKVYKAAMSSSSSSDSTKESRKRKEHVTFSDNVVKNPKRE